MTREPSFARVEPSVVDIGHHRRVDDWRADLRDLVTRARSSHSDADIREVFEGALADGPGLAPTLAPSVAVLGVAACASGWVGVLVRPSGQTTLHVGSSLVGLVEQVRDQETLGAVRVAPGSRQREVVAWLRTRPTVGVALIDRPQADFPSFAQTGLVLPPMYSGMGFDEEDLRLAGAAVIEAAQAFS